MGERAYNENLYHQMLDRLWDSLPGAKPGTDIVYQVIQDAASLRARLAESEAANVRLAGEMEIARRAIRAARSSFWMIRARTFQIPAPNMHVPVLAGMSLEAENACDKALAALAPPTQEKKA